MRPIRPTLILLLAAAALAPLAAAPAAFAETGRDEAAWLLQRGAAWQPEDTRRFQTEIGGGALPESAAEEGASAEGSVALKMLGSAILPGTGEVLLGKKHGFLLMAADVFSWLQVAKHHGDGVDKRDEYYAFADEHYSDNLLILGYWTGSTDPERAGEGALYFAGTVGVINSPDLSELEANLPLYVSKEEDRREYYENLGKWDQFIFGWDDYQRASVARPEYGYTPTFQSSDLQQPWVSRNRGIYRGMREDSNDSFRTRDKWLYVNIGLRVFSVLETAWLGGLLGGGDDGVAVAGHRVDLVTAPQGPDRGRIGAKIWF